MTERQTPKERLEYLRGEIEAERISYEEIAELQSLAEYIDEGDVLLLEWAGVPEFEEESAGHTPTPWKARGAGPQSARDIWGSGKNIAHVLAGGERPIDPALDEAFANAAYIVKACNEYEGLVDVLSAAPDMPSDFDSEDGREAFADAYRRWCARRDALTEEN